MQRGSKWVKEAFAAAASYGTFGMTHSPSDEQIAFRRKVAGRFGLVPNFFASAPDAPEIIERLWDFAESAYLDNAIPSLFKERLFVYLSRFCEIRYCIVRHCAFLVGRGHSAGDPLVAAQSVEQAIRLLKKPPPWERNLSALLASLEALAPIDEWPRSETEEEDWLIAAASLIFVEPGRSERARLVLCKALGGNHFERFMALLVFIRVAHYWTVLHPELGFEEDAQELLSVSEELARLLLEDPQAGRCDMSARLFAELTGLRELNQRRELEKAKRALEAELKQKELLIKEVNHRVKNSLQIVSSILRLQVPRTTSMEAADALRNAVARVQAIAAVHERLYTGEDATVVRLDSFLGDLAQDIGNAYDCPDGIAFDAERVNVPADIAIPLALLLNEFVTNAIKHVGPPCSVSLRMERENMLKLEVADKGQGPGQGQARAGLGTQIIEALHSTSSSAGNEIRFLRLHN